MLPLLGFFPTGNLTPEALDVVGRSSLQHDENISRNALASGPPDEPWANARRLVSRESGTMSDYDTDEEARRLLQRSLAINESLGNQRGLAASLHELANNSATPRPNRPVAFCGASSSLWPRVAENQ